MASTSKANAAKKTKVTVRGVTLGISAEAMDDIDVVEWLGELQEGNIFVFSKLVKRVFGDEYRKVHEALRNGDGIVRASDVADFFEEVLKALNAIEAKN